MPVQIQKRLNEAISTAEYFIRKVGLETTTPTFILDIGGGSTEIAFVHEGKIIFNDSIKFAGNNFVLSSKKLYKIVVNDDIPKTSDESEILRKFNLMFSSGDFLLPGWNNKLSKFYEDENFRKEVNFLNSIFFGSLIFYLGMHLANNGRETNKIQLALAGNGVRFLEIITQGNSLSEESLGKEWINFFLKMIQSGYSTISPSVTTTPQKLQIKFTTEPKKEVVFGLLYSGNLITDDENTLSKMLGLNIKFRGNDYKFNSWPEETINAVDLREAVIDSNIFQTFIKNYWDGIRKVNEYLQTNPNIDMEKVEESVRISLEQRGYVPIASPLFFEFVFAYMKEFTKNLISN
ncbi:MAG: rod shape-determining protein [Ignavibacterium sp.]|nr:rod shape-determining protein [Ignavibacterium sp.]